MLYFYIYILYTINAATTLCYNKMLDKRQFSLPVKKIICWINADNLKKQWA